MLTSNHTPAVPWKGVQDSKPDDQGLQKPEVQRSDQILNMKESVTTPISAVETSFCMCPALHGVHV